jgi:acyl-coenzyme A synthetase/AMP-(fatty) acid ligase/pimeloyl-ACP methyl ester carboxylesterase
LSIDTPSAADWEKWGINPAWHRMVRIQRPDAVDVGWSILDTGVGERGTIVCVHGNPTWGYLWRGFLETLSPEWRVIAVDQTGMGWSERSTPRTLETRVAELVAFCEQHTSGPLVLAAHDWGGPVALGAASSLNVQAVILGNTGVGLPARTQMPPLISTARRFVDLICRRTSAFVSGTAAMTKKQHREALRAPYRSADRRKAVADFVADIPLSEKDVSWNALQKSADNLSKLDVPLLLVWGGRDLVFHDRFLADLLQKAPHADVHRFPDAAHLVPLDEPMAAVASAWLDDVLGSGAVHAESAESFALADAFVAITNGLMARSGDETAAFTDRAGAVSWKSLAQDATDAARMLVHAGLKVGDRVAMLVPPSSDLLAAAFGVWLSGGVLVVADSGLGARGLRTVLRGANPTWVFGTAKTLAAAKSLGWTPGARMVCTTRFPHAVSLRTHRASTATKLPELRPEFEAAIVHTSGSTGPAKPVRYRHGALAAQREVIVDSFTMSHERGFLTSFAPFILLGPALGVPCVLPDIDVTKPSELDFDRFADVIESSQVDVAWLSPASARRIVETAAGRTVQLRLVMLAGAPISTQLASSIASITGADVRSPWGMTEAMPLTDGVGATAPVVDGTNTGTPLAGAQIVVISLDESHPQPVANGQWGEFALHAPWMFDGYDQQWDIEHRSELVLNGRRFHRSGDLGLIDANGYVHQLGRVQHALFLASQTVPSVHVEDPISAELGRQVAAVGIGPVGTQVIAVVIQAQGKLRLADAKLTSLVRQCSAFAIAAVLEGELPVDIRHQSKVKREVLAVSAAEFLAGR